MDNEIKDILIKLLEGQSRVENDITDIKTQIKKNTIELETIGKNITIIAEVQTSHKEQNDFSFKNTDSLIDEKTDLLGTALKSVYQKPGDLPKLVILSFRRERTCRF
ncbi:hypothetical protein [Clostridium estertheticum]|uniref:hypothetical protein n=1 Tax=Clostridium estertheticum TaxID=238834 RepID=UPI001CF3C460|nr:hypothetical protein [Clostridium estertheticum]MCB2357955.1 hypothetical protein [Clostridium estertheticum]